MQPDACLNRYLVAPCFMHFGLLACFHFEIASSAAFDIYIFYNWPLWLIRFWNRNPQLNSAVVPVGISQNLSPGVGGGGKGVEDFRGVT